MGRRARWTLLPRPLLKGGRHAWQVREVQSVVGCCLWGAEQGVQPWMRERRNIRPLFAGQVCGRRGGAKGAHEFGARALAYIQPRPAGAALTNRAAMNVLF